jgi:copper resistance protein B
MNAMDRLRRHVPTLVVAAAVFMPDMASARQSGHAGMQMPMTLPMPPAPEPRKKPETPKPRHEHARHPPHATTTRPTPAEPAPSGAMQMPMEMPMEMPIDHAAMAHQDSGTPRTPIPPVTDADRAAAVPPPGDHPVHDNPIESYTVFDRLEGWSGHPGVAYRWGATTWVGTDRDRLWLRSEGERRDGRLAEADLEVLYGHSVTPWWDVLVGVRHDVEPGASQDFAAIGVMGLAPYKFDVAATAYIGPSGQTAARVEADYDALLTNRLILQPLVEIDMYGREDARRGVGSGLSSIEAGLRLRYEVTRRFAPYIGIVHERAYGGTAALRRADGEDIDDTRLVAGVRIWF